MAASDERRRDALILSRVQRIQRRLNGEHALREAVVPLWCAATVVALHRLLLRDHTWVSVLIAFAVGGAYWLHRVRRRRVGVDEAAVLLDRAAGAGGLLLTRLERPVGEWELGLNDRLRQAPLPEVRRARAVGLGSLALLFLAVILWIPLPARIAPKANAAAATRVSEVEARAEALAKETPLEEGLESELARLRQELEDGRFDAADWEATDHLEGALAQKAAEAAAELARAAEAAEALEQAMQDAQSADATSREREALEQALMDLENGGGEGASGGAMDRALSQLEQQANAGAEGESGSEGKEGGDADPKGAAHQQAGAEGSGDGEGGEGQKSGDGVGQAQAKAQANSQTGGASQDGASQNGPSKSQVSQLKNALQQRQQQLAKAYGQQGQQGQSSQAQAQAQSQSQGSGQSQSGQSSQGQGQGQGQGAGQSGGAGQSPGDSNSAGAGQGQGSASEGEGGTQDGEGGVGRGGGPGKLRFNHNEVNPDRLAFSPLPEGHGGDEPGALWGLRAVDPRASTEPSVGTRPSGAAASGEAAPGHEQGALLPRNRELIRRYFDSQSQARPSGQRGVAP